LSQRSSSPTPSLPRITPTAAIDLQMHTVYSDGEWRPTDLLDYLAAHQFRVVAITDHDTLDHTDELVALGAERGVTVVPAVEVTTRWGEHWADLLCFAPIATGFTGDALRSLVARTMRLHFENTLAVHEELLRCGYTFPRQAEVLAAHAGALRRPSDNADLLVRHGYAGDFSQALDLLRDAGFHSIYAPLEEAVAAAHESGGVAILAHPGRQDVEISRFDPSLLAELLRVIPLDGIEVLYPTHTSEQLAAYSAFVAERALLRSAGSDSHGPSHRLPIPYPAATCAAFLGRCGIAVG